jgi:ArsR family transcriptional regulator, arsenate/arsenite/antimonite-responsive transcriptional repressor
MQSSARICCRPDAPPLAENVRVELAERLRALADPTRLGIVNRLAGAQELCVCDLTDSFGLSQPTISHHLRVLRDAGLVEGRKQGTWSYYRLNREAIAGLAHALSP